MGQINLHRLKFYACHGALAHEATVAQEFWVDVGLEVSFHRAGVSDRLTDTVDYSRVVSVVTEVMMGPSVRLLETLAVRLHQAIHRLDDRITRVEVRVTKAAPPLGVASSGVDVVMTD